MRDGREVRSIQCSQVYSAVIFLQTGISGKGRAEIRLTQCLQVTSIVIYFANHLNLDQDLCLVRPDRDPNGLAPNGVLNMK